MAIDDFRKRIDGLRDVLHEDVGALLRDMLDALTPCCGWSNAVPGPDGATEDEPCEAVAVGTFALAMNDRHFVDRLHLTARHLCARHVAVCEGRGWRVERLTEISCRTPSGRVEL